MKNNKIAFLTYSLAGGGIEKQVMGLTDYFLGNGIDCNIILLQGYNDYIHHPLYKKIAGRIRVLTSQNGRTPKVLLAPVMASALIRLWRIVKKDNIRLIVATDPFGWILSFFVSFLLPVEYVLNFNIPLNQYAPRYIPVMKPILDRSKSIVCVSKGLAKDIHVRFNVPQAKIHAVYNGIWRVKIARRTSKDTKSIRIIESLGKQNKIFISMGRLENQKNHAALIRSFALAHEKNPNIALVILGQGSLKTELENLVKKYALEKKTYLFGFTQSPEIYLSKADIFIMPSLYEGFGNAVIEAMEAGLPVIATDCPYGPREIIADNADYEKSSGPEFAKYGVLCPLDGNASPCLASVMGRFVRNKKLREIYRQRSLERSRFFTGKRMCENYLSLIRNLLN